MLDRVFFRQGSLFRGNDGGLAEAMGDGVSELEQGLEAVASPGFGWGVRSGENCGSFVLHPLEAACLSGRAHPRRRTEFLAGRAAAHEALGKMGVRADAVVKGDMGEPVWPPGVAGSITHKAGVAVAVTAPLQRCASLGVDLETVGEPVTLDIAKRVCGKEERRWVLDAPEEEERILRLKTIFSAKESVFKAFCSLTRKGLGFKDIKLRWCAEKHGFHGKTARGKAGTGMAPEGPFFVSCLITRRFVVTFLRLP